MNFKKYPLLVYFLLFCVTGSLFAQSKLIDSLKIRLALVGEDTNKILLLRTLTFNLVNTNPEEAKKYSDTILMLSTKMNFPKGRAMGIDIQGNILRARGSYLEAIQKHHEAFRIYDSIKHKEGLKSSTSNLGSDYFFLKNYKRALDCYNKAYLLTDTSDRHAVAKILNNIGIVYNTWGQYQKAIQIYLKALPFVGDDSTYYLQPLLYSSVAISYAQIGEYNKAISNMLRAINYQKIANNRTHYAASNSTLGGFYIEEKNFEKAKYHLSEAYRVAKEINAQSVIVNYYRNMAHLYAKQKKYKEAYNYLSNYTALNDSLITEEQMNKVAEMESKFQVDVKNSELAILNKDKQLKESELAKQTQWRYLLILLLVVVCSLLFISYRNVQLKKKVNKNLEAQNILLQNENVLAQYETLRNQVNPHFLFNSLNALSSLIKTDPVNAIEFTSVFSRLYRSVLELKDYSVITLSEELHLVDDYIYLQKIRFAENLRVEKNINVHLLQSYVPPFCVQMLIENAIKHNIISDEQPLEVSLYTEEDFLIVANTIQKRTNRQESTGVGIKNIIERFKIMSTRMPEFIIHNNKYIARIPLLKEQSS